MYPHVADVAVSVRSGGGGNQLDRQTIRQMGRTKSEKMKKWRKRSTILGNIVKGINMIDKQTRKSRERGK